MLDTIHLLPCSLVALGLWTCREEVSKMDRHGVPLQNWRLSTIWELCHIKHKALVMILNSHWKSIE